MGGPERHGTGGAADVDLDELYPPLIRRPRLAIAVAVVAMAALFLGAQVAAGIGAENRCVHRSDSSRYRWHGLEWR